MNLTEKEEKFIKHFNKLRATYIASFIFIILVVAIQSYIIFKKIMPLHLTIFQHSQKLQDFVITSLLELSGFSFFWAALLFGNLVGDFLNYFKIRCIINKLRAKNGINGSMRQGN